MDKKKQLVVATLFVDIENVHLIKDPGMIPFTLNNSYGYKSIIPLWDNQHYEYKDKYFKDIETPILKAGNSDKDKKISMAKWLWENALRIDVLHLYFYEKWTWFYIWLFKRKNPKGIIYAHCDTDGQRLIDYKLPKSNLKKFVIKHILLKEDNIKDVLWGIQNRENCEKLRSKWPFYNIEYIPNGVHWDEDIDIPYENKKNVLLTVARNGTPPKKTDILLEGFAAISKDFPQWNLRLVGTIEKEFEGFIEEYFVRYPELKNRVWFSGPTTDRKALQRIYSESKVFCLTSAWESFGLVTVEALSCGCFVIESDIASNIDVTQNGKYGVLFEKLSLDSFVEQLRACLGDEEKMRTTSIEAKKYIEENLTWEKVLLPVVKWLNKKVETKYESTEC